MKNILLSLSFLLILGHFFSCQNEPQTAQTPTEPAKVEKSAAPLAASDIQAKAAASCECYKVLHELRNDVRSDYQAGDSTAYERSDLDLIEERKKAKACTKVIIDPIKAQGTQVKAFQDVLIKICPDWATSVLIMNKVNWKPIEE